MVLDSRLRLPPSCGLVRRAAERPLWVLATPDADPEAERRLRERGVQVIRVPQGEGGRVSLPHALRALAERGLTRVFCEGGPTLADALAAADLIDEVCLLTSSRRLDDEGVPAIGPHLARALGSAFVQTGEEAVGDDAIAHYERAPCSQGS